MATSIFKILVAVAVYAANSAYAEDPSTSLFVDRNSGQLLRAEDHAAIRENVEGLKTSHRDGVRHEKQTENWTDRVIEEGDAGVEALIAEFPEADRQRLRQLTRNARREPMAPAGRRARRELLRAIRLLRD